MALIYKICPEPLWREAEREGRFAGAPVDLQDGYIHLSTAAQVAATASRHFAGRPDLLLVGVDPAALGGRLRYEPSRGGDLFPHLYGTLPMAAVRTVEALPLGPDGRHVFPDLSRPLPKPPFDPAASGWIADESGGFPGLPGPFWRRGDGAERRLGFLAEGRHLNRQGAVHGGMLLTFADEALGVTAYWANDRRPQVTVQLDAHFVSGVGEGEFVEAHCRVNRRTRSLLFMSGTLSVGDRVALSAQGIWKILGA